MSSINELKGRYSLELNQLVEEKEQLGNRMSQVDVRLTQLTGALLALEELEQMISRPTTASSSDPKDDPIGSDSER